MEIRKPDPRKKAQIIVLTVLTFTLVLIGWFFSFRDNLRQLNFSYGFSRLKEVKNSVKEITSDFKDNVQEITPEVESATQAINEKILEGHYDEETQKDNQTATE